MVKYTTYLSTCDALISILIIWKPSNERNTCYDKHSVSNINRSFKYSFPSNRLMTV